ncbi:MAG: hypothetical protein KAQ97_07405 [Candidatus Fermentibacteraceae bacterium]|nr:hypothetical protein [Candidatus Fermentibacteraceae bacterium]
MKYLLRITGKSGMLSLVILLISALQIQSFAQSEQEEVTGATWVEGRLVLEEITIRGELRTPQALFMMLKATPDLSNVLLERSFIEDVIRPVYPGAFANESSLGAGKEMLVLPGWVRYGSVALFGGLSAYRYYQGDDEQGLVFGVIAGLDLVGNLILDLVGN